MSWIVAAVVTGYGAYKGIKQQQAANKAFGAAEQVYGDIRTEKLGVLGEEKTLATTSAWDQFQTGGTDISMGAAAQLGQLATTASSAESAAGFAGSGTIERSTSALGADLAAKYKTDMQKLVDSRRQTVASADLSFRRGEISTEEAYHQSMSGYSEGNVAEAGIMGGLGAAVDMLPTPSFGTES